MSVGVLEAATGLNGGGDMADETIWVDSVGQPWRLNSYSGNYERLTDTGWRAGNPIGPLRKSRSVPSTPSTPTSSVEVVAVADENTYFVKGDKGETGEKGDKGDQGEQGEQGIQGIQGPPGVSNVVFGEFLAGTKDGVNTVFTTTFAYVTNSVALFYNGLREQPGIGFVESGPQEITIATAPDSLDAVVADYLRA